MKPPFPWQLEQCARLDMATKTRRLGHALLLVGRSGLGKYAFAGQFAKFALCENPEQNTSCDICHSCALFGAGNHPDFLEVIPEEEGKAITVEQIRDLNTHFSLTSHYQRGKVALVSPADAMTRSAANALLKRLEEPPSGALLMLVANRPDLVPATVRSRCQRLSFEGFDAAVARDWLAHQLQDVTATEVDALLAQASGAPLRALDLATRQETGFPRRVYDVMEAVRRGELGALEAAKDFEGVEVDLLVESVMRIVYELLLAGYRRSASYANAKPDPLAGNLHGLANQLDFRYLFEFLDLLLEIRLLLINRSNVREIDLLEWLWLSWSETVGTHEPHAVEA